MKNIEVIKRLYRAFSERDQEQMERLCHPGIIWRQNPGFPGGGIHVGIPAILSGVFDALNTRWPAFRFNPESFSGDDEKVLVEGHYVVQGKSENPKQIETAHVFRLENGKVVQFQQYTDTKSVWDEHP